MLTSETNRLHNSFNVYANVRILAPARIRGDEILATNPQTTITVTERDQSGEDGRFQLHVAAPIDMDTLPALFTNLITAIDTELTLGEFVAYNQNTRRRISNVAEGAGNREDKLLLTYQDNVTLNVYQTELPCRKTTLTTVGVGSDSVPPATWAATKIAWDAFVQSIDGNATTLLDVEIVGRNV